MSCVLLVGAALLMPTTQEFEVKRIPVALDLEKLLPNLSQLDFIEEVETTRAPIFSREIAPGDTLGSLFSKAGIDHQTMYKVLEADLEVLALDTLMPGNRIQFWDNDAGELQKLELYFNAARQVVFSRLDDGSFEVKDIITEGVWQNRIIGGEINGSFYLSAEKAGLNANEIQRINNLLKTKFNFARELRAGDTFQVLMNDQFIEGVPTGNTEVQGVTINAYSRNVSAFQHSDGNFYDENGESLAPAFQRIPLKRKYRLSSHFNPKRKHPITGRVRPHNGTDFATPIGTPVVAPGDGVVTMVKNHAFAGKYVVIEHDNKVRTRYLHLSQFRVRKGQRVKRGQVIALTGNTGASTGPHLHYEFHVNGRPIDPMKANIAEAKVLPKKQLQEFQQIVSSRKMMMSFG
ncbi:peptidase M23 [Shewanella maritima]|uniref:Peptidase M23 n=1 Tax=Shewanella maritima TaxID=2520507 RepID=A0A411PMK0_9GAMM|nr:peptidoglycan DD-metalloendopeptidase family protein [Shewanella maritima]QBF84754.1 peptidase M23 [Shewanella maritima]